MKQANSTNSTEGLLTLGPYIYAPSWFTTVIALLCFIFLVNLGFWQVRRSEVKQTQINEIEEFQSSITDQQPNFAEYLDLFDTHKAGINEAPLQMSGTYVTSKSVLYDNRVYRRTVGYHILSLFLPDNSATGVLINRGWVPLPEMRRDIMPDVLLPTKHLSLSGKIWIPNPKLLTFGNETVSTRGDYLVAQKVDLTLLSEQLGVQLAPFVLKLNATYPHGFVRDWVPVTAIGTSPAKHIGYAVQWFAMAVVLLIIYGFTNIHRSNQPANLASKH